MTYIETVKKFVPEALHSTIESWGEDGGKKLLDMFLGHAANEVFTKIKPLACESIYWKDAEEARVCYARAPRHRECQWTRNSLGALIVPAAFERARRTSPIESRQHAATIASFVELLSSAYTAGNNPKKVDNAIRAGARSLIYSETYYEHDDYALPPIVRECADGLAARAGEAIARYISRSS